MPNYRSRNNSKISNLVRRLVIVTTMCIVLSLLLMSMLKSQRKSNPVPLEFETRITDDVLINLKNFYFTMKPRNTSKLGNKPLVASKNPKLIMFLIFTSPSNFEKRNLIRRTWRSVDFINDWRIRHVFLLGLSRGDSNHQTDLREESNNFQDIVQGNFIDSYRNLSYKSVMGLTWVSQYCPECSFIVKTDDDVFTDPYQVTDLIDSLQFHPRLFAGMVGEGYAPNRIPDKRWYVSYNEFPLDFYPSFCLGIGYILSQDTLKHLLQASKEVPYFWIEDVYVTGILREHSHKIHKTNLLHIGEKYTFTDFSEFEDWSKHILELESEMKHAGTKIHNNDNSKLNESTGKVVSKLPWYFVHCSGNYIGHFLQLWEFVSH